MLRSKRERYQTALIQAAIFEVNRNQDAKPDPFTADDFMPDQMSEADELKEFVLEHERGELEQPDSREVKDFTQGLMAHFKLKVEPGVISKPARASGLGTPLTQNV